MPLRTCRACGCTEIRACPGRCAWIAADRCSTCPEPTALTLPINASHVVNATLEVRSTQTAGAITVTTYQGREFPQLVITQASAPGQDDDIHAYVGALEVDRNRGDLIAQLLNERRIAA